MDGVYHHDANVLSIVKPTLLDDENGCLVLFVDYKKEVREGRRGRGREREREGEGRDGDRRRRDKEKRRVSP